jgi:hypothetical protein
LKKGPPRWCGPGGRGRKEKIETLSAGSRVEAGQVYPEGKIPSARDRPAPVPTNVLDLGIGKKITILKRLLKIPACCVVLVPRPTEGLFLCSPPLAGGARRMGSRGGGTFPLTSVLSHGGERKIKGYKPVT